MTVVTAHNVTFASDAPLSLIAGPCQIESKQHAHDMAGAITEICRALDMGVVYKSSYDKANRSSVHTQRGIGMEQGLEILSSIR